MVCERCLKLNSEDEINNERLNVQLSSRHRNELEVKSINSTKSTNKLFEICVKM